MTAARQPKRPPIRPRKPRVPKLAFTANRDIGWHVSYRDPKTGLPKRHRFGITEKDKEKDARVLYHTWVAKHLGAEPEGQELPTAQRSVPRRQTAATPVLTGSLLEIASGLLESLRERARQEGEARRAGTIDPKVFGDRSNHIKGFLAYLNERHGVGAVGRMRLPDLSMADVEGFNRRLVKDGYSASQVTKRMQIVKAIIDRAGRPEHGQQVLSWNWESRDTAHGTPTAKRALPTVDQLKRLLAATDLRGQTWIWLGIGLGFGQKDLAAIRVGQVAKEDYDLRRGKTGIDRYGKTPQKVWAMVQEYTRAEKRPEGELLFITRKGEPLVHGVTTAVTQWWSKLRTEIGETKESLGGYYTLRHLGATEFGSRPGCSIGEMRRWLGHSASSDMADVYMRPIPPEIAAVVKWVREQLAKSAP